jgi:hypothetical protein
MGGIRCNNRFTCVCVLSYHLLDSSCDAADNLLDTDTSQSDISTTALVCGCVLSVSFDFQSLQLGWEVSNASRPTLDCSTGDARLVNNPLHRGIS